VRLFRTFVCSLSFIGTALDGYATTADFKRIVDVGLHQNDPTGLRDRTMNLLSYYSIGRGKDVRRIQLADIASLN
jgi:hypothetical protein